MKINNITISNFQSYYGEQFIEFGDGLNLIIGNGGKGKSKLFNAFYWVLFGKIYITDEGWCNTDTLFLSSHKAMDNYAYINKKALSETNIDGCVTVSVQLELTDDKGNQYIIERKANAVRKPVPNWDCLEAWEVSPSMLKITYDVRTGTKTVTGVIAEGIIGALFPEGIRGYIWFQGESLDELINFRKKQNLREAVKHISYYPYYEKLTSIITIAKKKIESQEQRRLKEVNKNNSEVRSLLSKIDVLRNRIEEEEKTRKALQKDIETIQVALAESETKVQGLAGFTGLVKEYDDCDIEIERINGILTELDNNQRRLLPTLWVLRGIDDMVEKCKHIISTHVEEECTLPEKKYIDEPSKSKLEEILNKDHRCFVCGSPVDEEHPHAVEWIVNRLRMQEEYYQALEDYRNNMEFSKQFNMFVGKIQDYPDSLLVSLKGIDKQYQCIEDDIEKLLHKRRRFLDKKNDLDKKIEDVKHKYGIDPHKEAQLVPNLNVDIKISRKELGDKQKLLRAAEDALREYTSQLRDAERDLKSRGAQGDIVTDVIETKWKNISKFLESICRDVQEKARKELLAKIEKRSNEFYTKFTEHDNGYKGQVEISDDYTIAFDPGLNTSHEDRKKMSIINALLSLNQEAIGTYYPFLSDAPTSSFDIETSHIYLKSIKDVFDQTIIMTKDVAVGSGEYNELYNNSKVSHIYQLDSLIHVDDVSSDGLQLHEVSTRITQLK